MKMRERLLSSHKLIFLCAILISLIITFHRLGESPLSGDGCFYSEVAKEMANTGDYLTPRFGYTVAFYHAKPPILFWANALSGRVFGFNNFAMRLPSALFGFMGIVALFLFVRRYYSATTAFISAVVMTCTEQYLIHARDAVTDMIFSAFFGIAMISFWTGYKDKKNAFFYIMGAAIGLAVMTRNIVGLFAYAVIGAFIILFRKGEVIKEAHFWGGVMLSFMVSVPWYWYMIYRYGNSFVDSYLGSMLHFGFKGIQNDDSRWYAYLKKIVENYWPWLPILIAGCYREFKNSINRKISEINVFVLLWAFVPLVIFQLSSVKQSQYIVPIYFPFAIITAWTLDRLKINANHAVTLSLLCIASLLSVIFILFPIIPSLLDSAEYKETIRLVPSIQDIEEEIIVNKDHGYSHYRNCFLFYGNRDVTGNSFDEIIAKLKSGKEYCYALKRKDYDELNRRIDLSNIKIVKETKHSVLFSNGTLHPGDGRVNY
jgi:4-amino-4-deoxy-L-arabinose transferase-like glycosyltransferase